jgi:hypothetical protein
MSTSLDGRNGYRLLGSIFKEPSSGCWLWRGQISNSGYGRMMVREASGNKMESAHRASYAAFVAPIPEGAIVRQRCGNRLCVNPEHLEIVDEPKPYN